MRARTHTHTHTHTHTNTHTHTHIHTNRERERDRQTDRQTDKPHTSCRGTTVVLRVTSFITSDHTSDTENYNIVQSIHIHDPVSLVGCTTLLINILLTVPNKSSLVIKVRYMYVYH